MSTISAPLQSTDFSYYSIQMTTGTNQGGSPQTWSLVVDSGSPVTFIGANAKNVYKPSPAAKTGLHDFVENFGDGTVSVAGSMARDWSQISPQLNLLSGFAVVDATRSTTFEQEVETMDGIFALAPHELLSIALKNDTFQSYIAGLKDAHLIPKGLMAIDLRRSTSQNELTGKMIFGGYDTTALSAPLIWSARQDIASNPYWGLNIAIPQLGLALDSADGPALVDTGTSLAYIPDAAYQRFIGSIPGAVDDATSGSVKMPLNAVVPDLTIKLVNGSVVIPGALQVIPEMERDLLGYSKDFKYSIWANGQGGSGSIVLGMKALEALYLVFDWDGGQIGLAQKKL
ncbi:uncharacterized protein L969DRAFT_92848 [Mixia osmundae IAM 14324]|uniref:Peptidase A1 domain-containing protein n=1 Tax=Mixia osmundae (strain CBS 9802 / IAM 14324 / JCM 22182 / KY 12970) TaxID=764103 RepID=G7DYR3_MIXOS|nr:uncharacterized protein L969DRAFT_92848 [Mixia osmundae IAM 14324]KEI41622.1 hypothetical protein L969DRAFT_92848 [Mixia osmundae IAM 14324]GAA95723.1 hypothetical protein E5Q_02380 [Mixia osmundae IAM 14324]